MTTGRTGERARRRAGAVLLLALPAVLFLALQLRTLDYGLAWMDEAELRDGGILVPRAALLTAFTRPLHLEGASAERRNPYYRPLQIVVASAIHHLVGDRPAYFRAVSLALGTANAVLFAALGWALLRRRDAALLAGGLAVAHPVGLEAYVWISGLAEALCAFFLLASLLAGLACVQSERRAQQWALGALAWLALVLALLSKEKAVIAPALLGSALAVQGLAARSAGADSGRPQAARPDLRAAACLLSAQGLAVLLYAGVLRPLVLGSAGSGASTIGGRAALHLASALAAWPAELLWLFLPLHSTTSDVVRIAGSFLEPRVVAGVLLAPACLAAGLLLLRRGRSVAALGLCWIWLAFLPTANLLPQLHARAERYLFLSSFGAALLLADLWAALPRRTRGQQLAGLLAAAVALLFLAERTWSRAPDWRSTQALFERDVAGDPYFREGRFHLARTLYEQGFPREAERHLTRLLEEPPEAARHWSYVNRLGVEQLACENRLALGRPQQALAGLQELESSRPAAAALPALRLCLGQAQHALGQRRRALQTLLAIAEDLPGEPPARLALLLARVFADLRQPEPARQWLERVDRSGDANPALEAELGRLRSRIDSLEARAERPLAR